MISSDRKNFQKLLGVLLLAIAGVLTGIGVWKLSKSSSHSDSPTLLSKKPEIKVEPVSKTVNSNQPQEQETKAQLQILSEILKSKNDNDPRLDRELRNLSPETEMEFQKEYNRLPMEARNERGTIVFLLARELSTQQDFDFLKQVVSEPPCLSLDNCAHASLNDSSDDPAADVTREYPQIVALKELEVFMKGNPHSSAAIQVLQAAMKSKSSLVSQLASSIYGRFKN